MISIAGPTDRRRIEDRAGSFTPHSQYRTTNAPLSEAATRHIRATVSLSLFFALAMQEVVSCAPVIDTDANSWFEKSGKIMT
jgi:hypothetical protein